MSNKLFFCIFLFLYSSSNAQQPYFSWANAFYGPSIQNCKTVKTCTNGDVYISGYFIDSLDFDPGPGANMVKSNGLNDCFIIKLNTSGTVLWYRTFGGIGSDYVTSCTIDRNDNLIVCGNFQDTVDFNPGIDTLLISSFGSVDAFILKVDSAGEFEWGFSNIGC